MADISLNFDESVKDTPLYADLKIVNGDLQLTNDVDPQGADAAIQFCMQRLRLFLGEAFLNLEDGVPYFQQILIKNADKQTVDGLLRDCILGTPGVTGLLSYASVQNTQLRTMQVAFTVLTAQGKQISAQVPIGALGGGA